MTTATRSVAVVATRLPNIDRRALSQAWFSALHLAQPATGAVAPRTVLAAPAGGHSMPPTAVVGAHPRQSVPCARARPVRPLPAVSRALLPERRGPAGELARRIERAIVPFGGRVPQRTSAVAVAVGEGRIHLLVRTDGATTRIIALCPAHHRERVDRALAHARFALAASGTRLEVSR